MIEVTASQWSPKNNALLKITVDADSVQVGRVSPDGLERLILEKAGKIVAMFEDWSYWVDLDALEGEQWTFLNPKEVIDGE